MLTEQAKEIRREYKRQWAHNNPDKVKAHQEKYWERKAAKLNQQPAIIPNHCKNYAYQEGSPLPESETSCRGCKNSYNPEKYDSGCKLPNGFDPYPRGY